MMNERARLRALDAVEGTDSVDDLWHLYLAVDSDEDNHSARVCVGERRRYHESYQLLLAKASATPTPAMATYSYAYAYGV